MRTVLVGLALAVAGTRAVAAQGGIALEGTVQATLASVTRASDITTKLAGPVLGAGGSVAFRRVALEGQYLEGQLSVSGSGSGARETFAEASGILRIAVGGGVTIGGGARLRAFIAEAGRVRWMRTEARLGWHGEVMPGRAHADVEVWQVLGAEVNAQGGADGGRGGTAGLSVRLPNSPFTLRLAYTADRVAFASGASEFVDGVTLGLRFAGF